MISPIVTAYLRDLATRLKPLAQTGIAINPGAFSVTIKSSVDDGDIKQLIDLADTLDEERNSK